MFHFKWMRRRHGGGRAPSTGRFRQRHTTSSCNVSVTCFCMFQGMHSLSHFLSLALFFSFVLSVFPEDLEELYYLNLKKMKKLQMLLTYYTITVHRFDMAVHYKAFSLLYNLQGLSNPINLEI